MKRQHAARSAAELGATATSRLEFLMQQTDIFSHFVKGGGGGVRKPAKSEHPDTGGSSPGRRKRMSEEEEDEELLESAIEAEQHQGTYLTQQPSNLMFGQLRDYQLEGLNWMINLHDNGINGILADEMGLGKTVQSIALLAFLRSVRSINGPHLVIVPKSTLGNWQKEFARWCPEFSVLRLQGPKAEREAMVRDELMSGEFDVILTTYEVVILERAALRKFSWCYILIDEAHRIKNEKSALSREVRKLESAHRLLITGTPLQNNLHELWALLNFLLPDVFSSSDEFDDWFSTTDGALKHDVVTKLHQILKPFLLRRLKVDVERDLPPKTETKLYISMTPLQREWYQRVLSKDSMSLNTLGGPERVKLLNILMQLRKVCNHPYLFDGAEPGPPFSDGPHLWESCGKMMLLHKLLKKLQKQGSRVLIFSQMTRMLDILEDYLRYVRYKYCRIDGNTKGVERDEAMEAFNAEGSDIFAFILSTRAGGLGINLYTADVVILFDSDWNPQMDLQAMDRAHRIGQKKPVRVFRFVTESTVEEKIIERAERKLYLDALVIQQGRLAEQNKALSKEELLTMVTFGADEVFKSRGDTVTDEDIDQILERGQSRTDTDRDRIQKDMQHNLRSFSLDSLNKADKSIYLFDSKDYSKIRELSSKGTVLDIGQRERKKTSTYDVDGYYKDMLSHSRRERGAPRLVKLPLTLEHQFFDMGRLNEIVEKENDLILRRKEVNDKLKDLLVGGKRESQRWAKTRAAELKEEGVPESDLEGRVEAELAARPENAAVESLQEELKSLETPQELLDEKEAILQSGFTKWSRSDFRHFISACERHGRAAKPSVIADVVESTERTAEEVDEYYEAFWHGGPSKDGLYQTLSDGKRLLERVERGEQRLERHGRIEEEIAAKLSRHRHPWRTLTLSYEAGGRTNARGFNEEEDRFLVCMMGEVGFGDWNTMRSEIRRAHQFRFDWFIKSRTAQDLQKRCEQLIRLVEAENHSEGKDSSDESTPPPKPKRNSKRAMSSSGNSAKRSKTAEG
jgi:SWI/SNF-related matrix-associated actin-dependent regulator of chromatin subfamily A member 5